MLKIRMQRTGRINQPSYRIVVVEHTASPKAGTFVEKVGTYDPKAKKRELNEERIKYWLSVGAKPSPTVHNMLVSAGVMTGKKINVLPAYKEPAKEEPAAETPAAPAAEAEAAAEETKEETAPAQEEQKEEAPVEKKPAESTEETVKAE